MLLDLGYCTTCNTGALACQAERMLEQIRLNHMWPHIGLRDFLGIEKTMVMVVMYMKLWIKKVLGLSWLFKLAII